MAILANNAAVHLLCVQGALASLVHCCFWNIASARNTNKVGMVVVPGFAKFRILNYDVLLRSLLSIAPHPKWDSCFLCPTPSDPYLKNFSPPQFKAISDPPTPCLRDTSYVISRNLKKKLCKRCPRASCH